MAATDEPAPADPIARKTWRTVEPLHAMVYFAPEAAASYAALGLSGEAGYFVSRSAPMGAVERPLSSPPSSTSSPASSVECMDGAWATTSPEKVTAARMAAADEALRRMLGDAVDSPEMTRAARLARAAAEVAAGRPEGRPLFAGHADLPWPEPPHLVLWHAQTLVA